MIFYIILFPAEVVLYSQSCRVPGNMRSGIYVVYMDPYIRPDEPLAMIILTQDRYIEFLAEKLQLLEIEQLDNDADLLDRLLFIE